MVKNTERYIRVHPKFKLNGVHYTIASLRSLAYEFIKEGEPYEESVGNFLLDWLNDKSYVTVKTSGSTGAPKAIKIKKIHMFNSARATAKHFKLPEKTTALLCLPAAFIAGKMMLVRAMVLGWHIDMAQPKSNPLDNVYRRYDFCAMTPFQLDNSMSRLHLLSKLIVGGGAISETLKKKLQGISTKIYETYGMTETVTHIAARRVNPKKKKDGSIPFKVLSKVSVHTDDRGCLVIKAPLVSSDPVITNDLVELLTYKKFVWLGRVDNVINSGGIKLYPEQIEQKLAAMIAVPFFVAGIPDDTLGEKLVLFVEQEEAFAFAKAEYEIVDFEKYEIPKAIFSIPRFERTANGKLQRGQTVYKLLKNSSS
ncbi:AMP-binding protein [uncultured Dokdonia sp.]|uniref:AMP-binding protein n=1 Tax=uncultured Dokdonia sp. TaxID=575653 RepID=UPI00261525E0|nr:AMP-binding protein [uncultured Dokdonia sp.]